MRIDGFNASPLLDRSSRPGTAVTPFREIQRAEELRREQPSPSSGSQGFERLPQARQIEQSGSGREASHNRQSERAQVLNDVYGRPLSNRVAQALASYGSTANMVSDLDAAEVLGLDLYA